MAYMIAAGCHDLGHLGFNNAYHMEQHDEIAVRYNDHSVLENFHVATTFQILAKDEFNIFSKLSK
jgi:hypothetical protein